MAFGEQFGRSFADVLGQKVVDAINAGAPPQTVATQLREQAKRARNASNYKALMAASGQALSYASQDQAGLINQAGMQNKAFTPSFGAPAALGAGIGNAAGNEAAYQGQLGQIAQDEQAAAVVAEQQAIDNQLAQQRADDYSAQVAAQQTKSSVVDAQGRPSLSVNLEKQVGKLRDNIQATQQALGSFASVSQNASMYGGSEGLKGKGVEWLKSIFGTQDKATLWKTEWNRLRNAEVVNNLPPGIASDKDIALVLEGFPNSNWDKEALKTWIDTYSKILKFDIAKNSFDHDYILNEGGYPGIREFYSSSIYDTYMDNIGGDKVVIDDSEVIVDYDWSDTSDTSDTVEETTERVISRPGSRVGG